ncbi:MAG: GtrA family protein [Candidatus Doudnabacteria bacterium]
MKFSKALIQQIWRFAIVGVINTGVDLLVLNLLITVSHVGEKGFFYTVFKSISFVAALTNSYFMNKYWTFAGKGTSNRVIEVSEFTIVSLIGFVINVAVSSLVVNLIPPIIVSPAVWPSIGALFGTAFGLVWNFIGYKVLVFEKKGK